MTCVSQAHPIRQAASWALLLGLATVALLLVGCRDALSPERRVGGPELAPAAAAIVRIVGMGSFGTGAPTPGGDRRDFDFDVASSRSGRVFFRDWSVVRADGSTGTLTVDPGDPATSITAFRDGSSACAEPTRGVEFEGVGRVNTGGDSDPSGDELLAFTAQACDDGPAGSDLDLLGITVPAHGYAAGPDRLTSGDIAKSSEGLPTTGDLIVTANTSGSNPDPDGYTVTVDGSASQAIATDGSVMFAALPAGDHSVELSGVADHCSVSDGTSRTVTVPDGGTAQVFYSVSCGGAANQPPVVEAGPNETVLLGFLYTLNVSFVDPDGDGPWSYQIEWGDGSTSSGSTSSQGSIAATHSYWVPFRTYRIRVTVTDNHGASASDTKTVTVIL